MKVKLLFNSPLYVCAKAIRKSKASEKHSDTNIPYIIEKAYIESENNYVCPKCMKSFELHENIGEKDKELIYKVGNKLQHSSVLEHLVYSFDIQGISRACLQELARHRIASMTVKSTRYTLKELKNIKKPLIEEITEEVYHKIVDLDDICEFEGKYYTLNKAVFDYLVFKYSDPYINISSIFALENVRKTLLKNISNDKAKYCLPENFKTSLIWTINARSLQNFLSLRTSKKALPEIRDLARSIYNTLPEGHHYLFSDCLH